MEGRQQCRFKSLNQGIDEKMWKNASFLEKNVPTFDEEVCSWRNSSFYYSRVMEKSMEWKQQIWK